MYDFFNMLPSTILIPLPEGELCKDCDCFDDWLFLQYFKFFSLVSVRCKGVIVLQVKATFFFLFLNLVFFFSLQEVFWYASGLDFFFFFSGSGKRLDEFHFVLSVRFVLISAVKHIMQNAERNLVTLLKWKSTSGWILQGFFSSTQHFHYSCGSQSRDAAVWVGPPGCWKAGRHSQWVSRGGTRREVLFSRDQGKGHDTTVREQLAK